MKNFFAQHHHIEIGRFLSIPENLKIFNLFRKIIVALKLIKNISFKFSEPRQNKIIILDKESKFLLSKDLGLLDNFKCFVLSNRLTDITEIYISLRVIKFILSNFFKRGIKINYLIILIKIINPKIIFTNIEISKDLYTISKYFKDKIKLITIQTSDLTGTDVLDEKSKFAKLVNIPELWCFSEYDKKIFSKAKFNIENFRPVGSIKCNISKNYFYEKKKEFDKSKYDICLLSETHAYLDSDFGDHENLHKAMGIVAEYTHRLCDRKNLKLVFTGRHKDKSFSGDMEKEFYSHFLKEYEFKIDQSGEDDHRLSKNFMQSKLIIGNVSTALREAFYFDKKVLACNLYDLSRLEFPSKGISVIKNFTYEEFEKRVLNILDMELNDYLKQLDFSQRYTMFNETNIKKEIYNEVKNI